MLQATQSLVIPTQGSDALCDGAAESYGVKRHQRTEFHHHLPVQYDPFLQPDLVQVVPEKELYILAAPRWHNFSAEHDQETRMSHLHITGIHLQDSATYFCVVEAQSGSCSGSLYKNTVRSWIATASGCVAQLSFLVLHELHLLTLMERNPMISHP